ncbi:unknown [Prevotella sp. CAG:386]|nr:unknown [Prevotella sp. CAG:386]
MNNKKQRNRLFTMLLLVMAILMPYGGESYRRACWVISTLQEGVLGEFICPGLSGSSEGPKRETTRL